MNQPDTQRSSRNVIHALMAIDATLAIVGLFLMLRDPTGIGLVIMIVGAVMLLVTGAGYLIMRRRARF